MKKLVTSNAVKIIALGLLFGTFAFGTVACDAGYEREEVGEELEEED